MELVKPGIHLDFVGKMKYAIIFSITVTLISIGSVISHRGLTLGIDFGRRFHNTGQVSKGCFR